MKKRFLHHLVVILSIAVIVYLIHLPDDVAVKIFIKGLFKAIFKLIDFIV